MRFVEADIDGYLDALGEPIRHQGVEYLAVVADEYGQADLGRIRISSNRPVVLVKDPVLAIAGYPAPSIDVDDTVTLEHSGDHIAKALKPNGQGFIEVELIEST